jgi:hypothetical protein
MSRRASGAGSDRKMKDVRSLEMLLDYAIIEGAELRLPLFVLLMRAARLELMTGIATDGGSGGERDPWERIESAVVPVVTGSVAAAGDVPNGCSDLIQDR